MKLPKQFVENVKNSAGEKGKLWLELLPCMLKSYCNKWQLSNVCVFEPLNYNYVAKAYSHIYKRDVVLKIFMPENEQLCLREYNALTYFSGAGCVKVLDADLDQGVLLLEALEPGIQLKSLYPEHDAEAVRNCVKVIQKIHSKVIHKPVDVFPSIKTWISCFYTIDPHKISIKALKKAIALAEHLLATQNTQLVLHGDLHQENILLNGHDWCAIDPKGVVGELAYEVGAFMRNPFPELSSHKNICQVIKNRSYQFSQMLNLEQERILQWSYVQSVLAACWALKDNPNQTKYWLQIAEFFQ